MVNEIDAERRLAAVEGVPITTGALVGDAGIG
jgi:hypothetical protein